MLNLRYLNNICVFLLRLVLEIKKRNRSIYKIPKCSIEHFLETNKEYCYIALIKKDLKNFH